MITDHEDGPASGKFTKTFVQRDYVIKFMNKFVNAMFSYHDLFVIVFMNEFLTFVHE
jgi:hypothetical protein